MIYGFKKDIGVLIIMISLRIVIKKLNSFIYKIYEIYYFMWVLSFVLSCKFFEYI